MSDNLSKLREPFKPHQISKLPKPTKAQTEEVKADLKKGIRCAECGAWHHPNVVHLDYVGHAALTDRLLDTDPLWHWEPLAFDNGLPAFDNSGGLWIKLTVCGHTRLGYGHAAAKPNSDPGSREKEVIGDGLRNAAMRFGAALDLWHKGDLHVEEAAEEPASDPLHPKPEEARKAPPKLTGKHKTRESLKQACGNIAAALREAADGGEQLYIDEVLTDWFDDIEQIKAEGSPAWWSNKDWGLETLIANARKQVEDAQAEKVDA